MHGEYNDLNRVTEQIYSEQEVSFLSPEWLNVLESDYIDVYEEAVDVLEDSSRIN